MKVFIFIGFVTIAVIGLGLWLFVRSREASIWMYNYRDEATNIVFVTEKFDLILPGRRWGTNTGSFAAGNGLMVVREVPTLTYTATGKHPSPILKEDDRLELSFPDVSVALLKGKTLKINQTAVPLGKKRVRVIVATNGVVTVTNAPVGIWEWNSLEYIKEVSSQVASNQAALLRH